MEDFKLGEEVHCKSMDWTGVIDAREYGGGRVARRYHVTNESGSMWFYPDELLSV
jgi:hypothetical protein